MTTSKKSTTHLTFERCSASLCSRGQVPRSPITPPDFSIAIIPMAHGATAGRLRSAPH